MWRVEDGKQMAAMEAKHRVLCLAVPKDGRWIAAGTLFGYVLAWNAKTHENVISRRDDDHNINGLCEIAEMNA